MDNNTLGVGSKIGFDDDITNQKYIKDPIANPLTDPTCRDRLTRKMRKGESQRRDEGSWLTRKSA